MTIKLRTLLSTAFIGAATIASMACTSLIAAPGATDSGSSFITYAADSHTLYGELYHQPAADHQAGEMRQIIDWDSGKCLGEIPEVAHTYSTIGNMNENGVAIAESTWSCRPELEGSGMLDYGSLIYIALQRSRTAREALEIITDLVSEYGYASEGESFSIADPTEVWILEIVGKGKTDPGAVWVARRVPDGYISGHANHSRIHKFPLKDKETLYSKDVISFARKQGYFNGKDKDFDFSRAYAVTDALALRGCDARVWAFYEKHTAPEEMTPYLDWILRGEGEPLPLWVKPAQPVSVADMRQMMRNHFEDTPLDMTKDIGAGPFDCPYRWRPMTYTVDSLTYTHERAIATQQTAFSFVADLNANRHPAMNGILWFGVDDANTCVYTPIFSCMDVIPPALDGKTADLYSFSWESMFWVNNVVANLAYNRYSQMIPDIRKVQSRLEEENDYAVERAIRIVASKAPADAQDFLRELSLNRTAVATADYKALAEFLFVKFMDGNIKKQNPDGSFARTPEGMPVQPTFGGYNDRYFESIVRETGDHLLIVEPNLQ